VLVDLNGLCRLGGLGEGSGCPTEAVEVRGYSFGVLSNALYVVKTDLTTFYRLANLRGGTIEFQLDLQLLEPIYLPILNWAGSPVSKTLPPFELRGRMMSGKKVRPDPRTCLGDRIWRGFKNAWLERLRYTHTWSVFAITPDLAVSA